MAGLFGAQSISAQDTVTVRYFNHSDGNTYAVLFAEDDNEQCQDDVYLTQVFSWDSSTNILSIDNVPIPAFTNQVDINYWNNVFSGSSLFVFPVDSNNNPSGGAVQGVTFN